MFKLASILVVLLQPFTPVSEDRFDLIEVNHFYDESGKPVFDQAIFWEWIGDRYVVQAWRMIKRKSQVAVREDGGWSMTWGENGIRKVKARDFRETWTQYDPELADRDVWPKEMRSELSE